MKKTFVIQVEYPDNDIIPSEEVMEVTQECIENHLEKHFGANIMDGDYDRIKVKEVTDFVSLVNRMREAQKVYADTFPTGYGCYAPTQLESEVDEYLTKMEV